jgi:hypothetical protein
MRSTHMMRNTYPMALMKPKQSGSSGGSSSTYIESHDVRNFSLKAFSAKKIVNRAAEEEGEEGEE